jgi:hypothetical protein
MKPFRNASSSALSSYGATCRRIVSDFTELPGLRITAAQAQRLWNLEPFACEAMLNAFVDAGFLARDGRGEFVLSRGTSQGPASA